MKKYFNTKNIIIAVLGILLLLGPVGKWLGWDNDGEPETKVEIRTNTVVQVDTIEKIIERVIIKEPVYTNITRTIKLPTSQVNVDSLINTELFLRGIKDSMVVELPVNRYQDTLDVDGATLAYDHQVAGYLEDSKYRITYPKETITVTDSVFTTITQTKNRIYDFFLVGGYQVRPYPEYEVGVDFITKKWKIGIGVGYDGRFNSGNTLSDFEPTIKVNAGIRLFGQ